MSNIKVFKTLSGEDIITEVVEIKDTHYIMKNPAVIVLQETEQGIGVGLAPFLPYANGNIALYANSVMAEASPDYSIFSEYRRVFNPIEVPSNSIITPK